MVPIKANDHWAFLEEIEAPMWVDLTLEAKSTNQNSIDEWFHTSHPFHHHSSHELKSAFSRLGEAVFELAEPFSPELPDSVSKSRGKDYKSEKWNGQSHDFSLIDQHSVKVVTGKSSLLNDASAKTARELQPKLSFINSKGTSTNSKSSLVSSNSATSNIMPNSSKPLASNSEENKGEESRATSTITTERSEQQKQKFMEVTSQAFGHTSMLLSVMRKSLRKSCVTRQASRVETTSNSQRQSSGRKSSSSKSSVGSSSNPSGYDVKISTSTSKCQEKLTLGSRNVARLTQAAKNKIRSHSVTHAQTKNKIKAHGVKSTTVIEVEERDSNTRRGKFHGANSGSQEAAKPKTVCKALRSRKDNGQRSCTSALKAKEREGLGRCNAIAVAGKENALGRKVVSQKSIAEGAMVKDQKGATQTDPKKRVGFVKSKENINGQKIGGENLNPTNATRRRVYFR